jgi:hypothetical protein
MMCNRLSDYIKKATYYNMLIMSYESNIPTKYNNLLCYTLLWLVLAVKPFSRTFLLLLWLVCNVYIILQTDIVYTNSVRNINFICQPKEVVFVRISSRLA